MITEMTDKRGRRTLGLLIAVLVASIWLYHGLYNKLLHGEPRHLRIVQAIPMLAGANGELALVLVGAGEVCIAIWTLSGYRPYLCAGTQTAALLSMNVAELIWARPYLLAPAMLIPLNLIFLSLAWLSAVMRSNGLAALRRHPFPVEAHFDHCLVLTYAYPAEILRPLVPPGLTLDASDGFGFVAIAMVQTQALRPALLPPQAGQNFFLAGYRVFTKLHRHGRSFRGLRILRSDTNRRLMVAGGNLLTHYNYRLCSAEMTERDGKLEVKVQTRDGRGNLRVVADLAATEERLPAGSPFAGVHDALRFAGPLPRTFDFESETNSIISISAQRKDWQPRLVPVEVTLATFLETGPLSGAPGRLASAFYLRDIDYRWERGVRYPLSEV